jgi:hypothetical protein
MTHGSQASGFVWMKGQHPDLCVRYDVFEEKRNGEAAENVNGHKRIEEKNAAQEHETGRKPMVLCRSPVADTRSIDCVINEGDGTADPHAARLGKDVD